MNIEELLKSLAQYDEMEAVDGMNVVENVNEAEIKPDTMTDGKIVKSDLFDFGIAVNPLGEDIYLGTVSYGSQVKRISTTDYIGEDVINDIKGYGGDIKNKTPGYYVTVDFGKYSLGQHSIKIEVLDANNTVLNSATRTITIKDKIVITTGTYGISGLKAKGDSRGSDLIYYQYGSGPNVFFATYCVHGFESCITFQQIFGIK